MNIAESFMTFMERGGLVMWPLLGLSVITLAITIERTAFWFRVHGRTGRTSYRALTSAMHNGDWTTASRIMKERNSPYNELASAILESPGDDALAISASEETRPAFERGMVILSAIVTAAPMLGILGTVVGIIQSFELLGGDASINDPRQVSGGIAEALISTACGLVVALLALFPYMIFQGQQDRGIGRMEALIASALHGFATTLSATPPSEHAPQEPSKATTGA